MDRNTIRILSLDGGGVRGYLSLKWLQKFMQSWGIKSDELWKYFDVIAGTSIGGIQALGYAYGKSPDELEQFFLEKAKRIFTIRTAAEVAMGSHNAGTDSNRPNKVQKAGLITQNDPFYTSAYDDSNYGSNILHQTLVDNFGDSTLGQLKTKVVIPAYEDENKKYILFSNYNGSMLRGEKEKIVDVARATSAAPVYLPEYKFGGKTYWDGGVFQNNPTEHALSLGKALKPAANRYCVLSLGTGAGERGFDLGDMPKEEMLEGPLDTIVRIFSLFEIASSGGQESVDFNMRFLTENSLDQLYYYRFQPKLEYENTELDNSDSEFLKYMKETAEAEYAKDEENINNFLGHLTL